ncbi:aldolase [Vibrio pectenicida]|uniref:Aldolase n=1 Tax=Vibrio pectenicida TaxID=62763 RepID=A0A7Y3ZY19_9VIBR|nr:aldolase/citrate lyase family protein [Vibrio pectenicida]NOH70304.1 aldolase [Vibrio pectenicida]
MFNLMFITNNKDIAQHAVNCGVDRIFLDTESLGKKERQGHLDTVMSDHKLLDMDALKEVEGNFELLVRINPLHHGTADEVKEVISRGADIIMLPMFYSESEVETVSQMIDGRAQFIPLVETKSAIDSIDSVSQVEGVTEVHIGLNDLHLDMKLDFMFELFTNGIVERAASVLRKNGKPFGIGGIAKLGEGSLPADIILSEHIRIGSSGAILSRAFHSRSKSIEELKNRVDLKIEVARLRDYIKNISSKDAVFFKENKAKLNSVVKDVVKGLHEKSI